MVREGANSSAHSLNTFRGMSSGPEPLLTSNPFSTSISEKTILEACCLTQLKQQVEQFLFLEWKIQSESNH